MSKKSIALALRLSQILQRLNLGERISSQALADEFGIDIRTIQRDMARLSFLEWEEQGNGYYKINRSKLGILTDQEIQRFAKFASISELFPKIDREFFQQKLIQSVEVKGFQYEDVKERQQEFDLLKQAIEQKQLVHFKYKKQQAKEAKFYQIAPYSLVNKNGLWYLIGTENHQPKTFRFTQINDLLVSEQTFDPNQQLIEEIRLNDSLSHGNQISEVLIHVSAFAAPYFQRRKLLPNQEIEKELESGEIVLICRNVHELDIVPQVQYWIPHLTIISPKELKQRMVEKLQDYLSNS